jgi:hypothetical protein
LSPKPFHSLRGSERNGDVATVKGLARICGSCNLEQGWVNLPYAMIQGFIIARRLVEGSPGHTTKLEAITWWT